MSAVQSGQVSDDNIVNSCCTLFFRPIFEIIDLIVLYIMFIQHFRPKSRSIRHMLSMSTPTKMTRPLKSSFATSPAHTCVPSTAHGSASSLRSSSGSPSLLSCPRLRKLSTLASKRSGLPTSVPSLELSSCVSSTDPSVTSTVPVFLWESSSSPPPFHVPSPVS